MGFVWRTEMLCVGWAGGVDCMMRFFPSISRSRSKSDLGAGRGGMDRGR